MSEQVLVDRVGGREYRLVRRLGEGGFGEVYLAHVRTAGGLDQRVAVKLILPDTDARADAVQRLRDEAAVLARLHHPVILAAHDLVELDSRVALVTEYVEGQDLRECIKDKADPIPLGALVEVIGQVAGALEAAWATHGIVHRDIKPANIRIGRHANVKLLDFGIAKSAETHAKTQADLVMGSLLYLAPERFDPSRAAHPVADVFALGCILYERVAGVRLFNKVDAAQLYGLARSAEAFDAYVGRRLEVLPAGPARDLARRTLARDPEVRISPADLAAACDALVRELPADQTLRAWCRRRRWPAEPEVVRAPRSIAPSIAPEAPPPTPVEPPAAEVATVVASAADVGAVSELVEVASPETPASLSRTGRTRVDSGTLAFPVEPRRLAWFGLGTAAVIGLVIGGIALGTLGTAGVVWLTGDDGGDETLPPLRPRRERVRPVERVPAPPAPAPAPAPVTPPHRGPAPPAPVLPPLAPPSPTTGTVVFGGAVPLALRSDDGATASPGEVAAGRWTLLADFGYGPVASGVIEVPPGGTVRVRCNSIRAICESF